MVRFTRSRSKVHWTFAVPEGINPLGCDFVFENDYPLLSIKKRKEKVLPGKHLLNIAPAKVMVREGIDLGQTILGILQNVEEHELYFYNHDERIEFLEKENKELREIIMEMKKEMGGMKEK